jgi:predicted nuclease of predicted toxin-antitoxin system
MKFLIDANLPWKLKLMLEKMGFDVVHTDDLPNKEFTTDEEIRSFARVHERIIITKDSDFLQSHILRNNPRFLLLISTGNISNRELLSLVETYFNQIALLFDKHRLIELTLKGIVLYEE